MDQTELLRLALRALEIHAFMPVGQDTRDERDTCQRCGRNFRDESHLRVTEGHPSDIASEAIRALRKAL